MISVISIHNGNKQRSLVKTAMVNRSLASNQNRMIEMSSFIKDYIFSILPKKLTFIYKNISRYSYTWKSKLFA